MILDIEITISSILFVILGFLAVYILFLLILSLVIDKIYFKKRLATKNHIYEIDYKRFNNFNKEEFEFKSGKNTLRGGIYYYSKSNTNIAIYMHGFGVKHTHNLYEIEMLASLDYTVYAFDMTATGKSDGAKFGGAPQAIKDLECCIKYVQQQNPQAKILLMGHSMGAYAVGCVLSLVDVKKAIVVAPFDNIVDVVQERVTSKFGKKILLFKTIYKLIQRIRFGKYSSLYTFESLYKTNVKTLVIHGTEDKTIPIDTTINSMMVNNNRNVKYLLLENKLHSPLLSEEAIIYNLSVSHTLEGLKIKYKKQIPNEEIEKLNKNIDLNIKNKFDEKVLVELINFIKEA